MDRVKKREREREMDRVLLAYSVTLPYRDQMRHGQRFTLADLLSFPTPGCLG